MRVSLAWLAEWIPLAVTPEVLAERLTLGGLEVEALERTGPELGDVRVGRVVERAAHPGADRLSLCRVDTGDGELREIVCGAPNVAAGQKVAVALPGARLPDGRRIKRSKIRGVGSEGMICSERELGLGDDADGILVLDPDAAVGAALAEVVGAGDVVLEISITPNRGDCASILGVAREVRAHFGGTLTPPPAAPVEGARRAADAVRIVVDDAEGCHHFAGRVVHDVRVGPSPAWLAARLESFGIRPISNVVDVTNLVMAECGKPIHAYDLATLRGGEVRVRSAREGEKLTTLDGQQRELSPGDIVITDAERAIGLGGVMGGAETEVSDRTSAVLIESAHFRPARVRRTARRLGLHSEASYRFERGVDRESVVAAADRAARLLAEICGGEVAAGVVEARGDAPEITEEILLEPARVCRLLGLELEPAEIEALLSRVDVASTPGPDGRLRCRIPSHRNDLHLPVDLAEEVGRIYGYERIPATLPAGPIRPLRQPPLRDLTERLRNSFLACGLLECMMTPFQRSGDLDRLGLNADDPRRKAVQLLNPVTDEEAQLSTTLLPGLLRATHRNLRRQVGAVRLFELGRRYLRRAGGELPDERPCAAAVLTRGSRSAWWEPPAPPPLFFEMKGVAEALLLDLGYEPDCTEAQAPYLHPGAACAIRAGGRVVGVLGELHPDVAGAFEVEAPCAVLELELDALATPLPPATYREVSRQPRAERDLAVLLDREVAAGEVLAAIRKTAGGDLVSLELFDRYDGPGVPPGKVSLAFRLALQRHDRTLVDTEVNRVIDRVVAMLARRFGGELR